MVAFSMHKAGLVTELPVGAVPGEWPGVRALLLSMAGAGILCASALAAAAPAPAASQAREAAAADFIGAGTCAKCHADVASGFAGNPHTRIAQMHGKAAVACEDCHGAGRAHAESGGDKTKIVNPANATAREVDGKCLGCHQGQHANMERSAHGEAGVSCLGCHTIHNSKEDSLLKAPQPALCFPCHSDVRPQFSLAFHHKVNEGLVQCTDCHDPHGAKAGNSLQAASQQDMACVKCHENVAGPFVYEHGALKVQGCTACHTPHGGANPGLLNRAKVDTICMLCHSPAVNFTAPTPAGPSHNQAGQPGPCTSCHTAIHGSNTSKDFLSPSSGKGQQ
jgi:DmsE family decaheme c-type cytochrome